MNINLAINQQIYFWSRQPPTHKPSRLLQLQKVVAGNVTESLWDVAWNGSAFKFAKYKIDMQ